MVFKLKVRLSLAALFVAAAFPVLSQVAPSSTEKYLPLEIGGGVAGFDTHYASNNPTWSYPQFSGRLFGPTVWADWYIGRVPRVLHGIGIEVEGRHLDYARSSSDPRLREDTGAGGIIYTWRHYQNFHPFGKALGGFGSIDFDIGDPYYHHDTRTFYAPGGGIEYRVWDDVWARGEYERQFWTGFGSGTLEPQGFTLGVVYDFRHAHFHRIQR
jgi:opacity protein-like surface antigen